MARPGASTSIRPLPPRRQGDLARFERADIGAVKVRATAIVFIDWFRIMLRHGSVITWRRINTAVPQLRPAAGACRRP
jgi:hypothetical protein